MSWALQIRYILLMVFAVLGCVPSTFPTYLRRSDLERDVEGYAIASCFFYQDNELLKRQGDAWASSIVQRSSGGVEGFIPIAERIKLVMIDFPMTVARVEGDARATSVAIPLLYCYEIIDLPSVREIIQESMKALRDSYRSKIS